MSTSLDRSSLLDTRYTRYIDAAPHKIKLLYYIITAIIGIATLFTSCGIYLAVVIYCFIRYHHININVDHIKPDGPPNPHWPPVCVAYGCTAMRLWMISVPHEKRTSFNLRWQVYFHLLQFATFLEYIANAKNPYAYFTLLNRVTQHIQKQTKQTSTSTTTSTTVPYFPVGDGLGIGRHDLVLRHIQNRPANEPIEKFETLAAWSVSSSIKKFCTFIPIFKSSADPNKVIDPAKPSDAELGRKIVFSWLHNFQHHMSNGDVVDEAARLRLWRIIPRICDGKASDEAIMVAVGELLFFLATGGELSKAERAAFLDTVKNPFIFFPDWFNFMVAGHALERRSEASYDVLRKAFARYASGKAMKAAFNAAGSAKSPAEVLRLITIVYSVAGSVAPARLSVSIIKLLWSNPDKYVPMFHKNPKNFIRECARLYEGIPIMVNVGSMSETVVDAARYGIHIPPHTIMHCSMTQANRDPRVFKNPNEFNPDRDDLDELIGWNGREADICNPDEEARPPRYCPGHDLSLEMLTFIISRFAPMTKSSADIIASASASASTSPLLSSSRVHLIPIVETSAPISFRSMLDGTSAAAAAPHPHNGVTSIHAELRIHADEIEHANGNGNGNGMKAMNGDIKSKLITSKSTESKSHDLNQFTPEELIHCMYDLVDPNVVKKYKALLQSKYYHALDPYTRLVIALMHVAVSEWNSNPPRAIDMVTPANCNGNGNGKGKPKPRSKASILKTGQGLKLTRIDLAKFIAQWDEDIPAGSPLKRVIARKVLNLPIWEFADRPDEFDSLEDAISWRHFFFSGLPRPNVVFYREVDHSNDDALITQLAFTGIACHHTKLINWDARAQFPGLETLSMSMSSLTSESAPSSSSSFSTPIFRSKSLNGPDTHNIALQSPSQLHRVLRQTSLVKRGSLSHSIGIPEQGLLHDRAVYVNDMTGLYQFRVREPYERYGAAVYFDRNFAPVGIYWSHGQCLIRPGDSLWKWACYVWRSTMFAYVTIADHLITNHMIEANALSIASRQWLPPEHPLRHFLKPFTYHTISVNYQAAVSLVNNRGLVHRIWAFDYDEFLKVCDYISMNYTFRILPDIIDERMRDRDLGPPNDFTISHPGESWDKYYPIVRDADEYWDIVHGYVVEFFRIHYGTSDRASLADKLPADEHLGMFIQEICKQLGIAGIVGKAHLIDVISQLIVSGTAIHEQVGQISEYLYDPTFIGCKLRQGHDMNSVQTLTQLLTLTVVTGLKMPGLLEDWSHLIPQGRSAAEHDKHHDNYHHFIQKLESFAHDIDERNKTRKYPFQSFNPRNLECSTSI